MVTAYLGTKFDGHDTAAFLLIPQFKQAYGLSTERLTRVKHDRLFPVGVIERIAQQAEGLLSSVDKICCANSFLSHRTRIYALDQYERDVELRRTTTTGITAANGRERTAHPACSGFGTLHEIILRHLRRIFPRAKVSLSHFDHEYCHARSSYDFGPIDEALVLTMDGEGDSGVFSRAYVGCAGRLTQVAASCSPHRLHGTLQGRGFDGPCSLGGIYAFFTHHLGFVPNSEEGKIEALAAAGRPISWLYASMMRSCRIGEDLSLQVDAEQLLPVMAALAAPEGHLVEAPADLAATAQLFLEDVVVAYTRRLLRETGSRALCLSGGVFGNVLLNMQMADLVGGRMYVAPAVGDEGSAQGAASASFVADVGEGSAATWLRDLSMPYFGTSYDQAEAIAALDRRRARLHVVDAGVDIADTVAQRVHTGEIGGLFQGRMEFGPRALGNRSILASPRDISIKNRINAKVKRRPPFQPVCPAVLRSELERLFPTAYPNAHMTCAFPLAREHRTALPGAAHLDGTSRVQFVGAEDNPLLFEVLRRMQAITGYGVILNTSFNIHGKTIVETPDDAIDDFLESGMDFLLIMGILVERALP